MSKHEPVTKTTRFCLNRKWVYSDRTMVKIGVDDDEDGAAPEPDRDEISRYEDARTIGACEACWRTFKFPLYRSYPPVIGLAVHEEKMQRMMWVEGTERQVAEEDPPPTPLTHWFEYIKDQSASDDACQDMLYQDFPGHCSYTKVRREPYRWQY